MRGFTVSNYDDRNRDEGLSFHSLLDCIGNTPLIKLDMAVKATLLAKLEYLNPSGSIKDRTAFFMVEQAEKQGLLKSGGTIIEASSGNQGIALAMIGAIKGYSVIITVPDRTSQEKIATLKSYGAKVHICPDTDDLGDPDGYRNCAKMLHQKTEGSFMPNQYINPDNVTAHLATGAEIWQQTKGLVTHCFIGMGSCGTISGVGRYLKRKNPAIKIIGIDAATSKLSCPDNPKAYQTEGIGVDVISDTLDRTVIDQIATIHDQDAFAMTRSLAKQGYLVGLASGAVMSVALDHVQHLPSDAVVVVIFTDSGRAYLSKAFHV